LSSSTAALPLWRRPFRWPAPEYGWALLALTLIVVCVFDDLVFRGHVLYERDVQTHWHEQTQAFFSAVSQGAWPLWDPHSSFGEPLWAYPTQIPYPTTWLSLLFPPWWVYTAVLLPHLVFSGMGVYVLARRLGVSPAGAFAGAAAWVSCGPYLSLVNMMNNAIGVAWLPWIVLAAGVALDSGRAVHAFLWGACLAAPVLVGSEAAFMGGLLTAADTLRRVSWRTPRDASNRRLAWSAATALTCALALSAAQWVPTLELTHRTAREAMSRDDRTAWSMDLFSLAQVALPFDFEDLPFRSENALLLPQRFLASLYLGIPVLALAGAAFVSRHRRQAPFFAGVIVVAVGFALGRFGPLYDVIVLVCPLLKAIRFPVKGAILAAFACSVLAAMGVDAWREAGTSAGWRRYVTAPAAALTLAAAAAAALLFLAPEAVGHHLMVGGGALTSFGPILLPRALRLAEGAAIGAVVTGLALYRRKRPAESGRVVTVVIALAVLDLITMHRHVTATVPSVLYRYRPATLAAFEPRREARLYWRDSSWSSGSWKQPPPGMSPALAVALTLRDYLVPPVAATWGIAGSYEEDKKGIHPDYLIRMFERVVGSEGTPAHLRFLQLGAVTHVVSLDPRGTLGLTRAATGHDVFGDPVYVYTVPDPLPRTFVATGSRVADDAQALDRLAAPDFDPRREVVLAAGPERGVGAAGGGTSRIVSSRADRVEIEATLAADGFVVLVEAFDPWWRATVDDAPVPVYRANVAFRAVPVAAGRHTVLFTYRPAPVITGLVLSALGIGAGLVLALRAAAPVR
jgi:hypothetical protein